MNIYIQGVTSKRKTKSVVGRINNFIPFHAQLGINFPHNFIPEVDMGKTGPTCNSTEPPSGHHSQQSSAIETPPPPKSPDMILAGGFPLPPTDCMKPADAWRANLDHYKTHLDFERIGVERFKALVDRDKISVEAQRLDFERHKLDRQWNLDSAKATYDFARFAINSTLILNGGAALAIMQHLGGAKDATSRFPLAALAEPLLFLCGGLASGALSAAFSYLSQNFFTQNRERIGAWFQGTAILAWIISLTAFSWAIWRVARTMMGL